MNTLATYLEDYFNKEGVIFFAMPIEEAKIFQNLISSYKEFRGGAGVSADEWTSKLFQAREESRYAHDVFLFMAQKGPKSVRLKGDFMGAARNTLKYMLYPAQEGSKYLPIFESSPNEVFSNLWRKYVQKSI